MTLDWWVESGREGHTVFALSLPADGSLPEMPSCEGTFELYFKDMQPSHLRNGALRKEAVKTNRTVDLY